MSNPVNFIDPAGTCAIDDAGGPRGCPTEGFGRQVAAIWGQYNRADVQTAYWKVLPNTPSEASALHLFFDRHAAEALDYEADADPALAGLLSPGEIRIISLELSRWKIDYTKRRGLPVRPEQLNKFRAGIAAQIDPVVAFTMQCEATIGLAAALPRLAVGAGKEVVGLISGRILPNRPWPRTTPRIQFRPVREYDIVEYRDPAPGLEKHHGILDEWANQNIPRYNGNFAPAVVLSQANHNATRAVLNRWRYQRTGSYFAGVDWSRVTAREMGALAEAMFDAANVPRAVRQEYYRAFNNYAYRLRR